MDDEGKPLHTAMLYTDPRGGEEVQALIRQLGDHPIAEITGLRPHQIYILPKIMWLKKHRPEVYARTARILLMGDYVVYHLTGKARIDIMYDGYFSVVSYVIPGKYVAYAFLYTGGALIQWAVQTFAEGAMSKAAAEGLSINAYLEKHSESPTGLLVLPHFAGAAPPYMDTGSGIRFTRLHATGTVGSAMLTGIAIGLFHDLQDAAAHMVEETRTYIPRPDLHEKYCRIFERYEKVYEAVCPLMDESGASQA